MPTVQGSNKATRSEANATIFVYIYILDIDSDCPYLLTGETTFHLTSGIKKIPVFGVTLDIGLGV